MRVQIWGIVLLLLLSVCLQGCAPEKSARTEAIDASADGDETAAAAEQTPAKTQEEETSQEAGNTVEAPTKALEDTNGATDEATEAEPSEAVPAEEDAAEPADAETEAPTEAFAWTFAEPETYQVDSSAVEAMFSELDSDVRSAVIVKNGAIIGSYFADGYDEESVFTLQSVSKSITSTLVGIAIDQGYIGSVDDYAADYLPALAQSEYPAMRQITIRHLLTHTSGLVCTENSPEWDNWRSSSDWVSYLVSQPMTAAPGTYFEYSTGNIHILSAILENVTGMSLIDYAYEVLFTPLGITSATMEVDDALLSQTARSSYDVTSFYTDPTGVGDGGNEFSMTAYDLARIGLLYLQEGEWMGQQIVSADYIQAATTTQAVRSSDGSQYGFCWWTERSFGDAGYTGYFAQGHYGQFIFVVPEVELVVVFTGMLESYSARQFRAYVDTLVNGM